MNGALALGVIGHVDHGKTALVRALTGIETDRLEEERKRGLSIVLGFAFLDTGHGVVDLIDVPGHEDFVRAMIGGATALDGVVLCVAANEGVMPQTVEHFNIARLLGVEQGFIVITKTDLVDAETLALVREDVGDFVRNTFLDEAPMLEVSPVSGDGMDAVRRTLSTLAATPVEREARGRFFLPLDRVFTMRGFGLVVTGTLRSGNLSVGDAVELLPGGASATVRALQNHHRSVDQVSPGQRVAVNLRQVDRDQVRRGHVLASPGSVKPTICVDAELSLLEAGESAVKNGAVVRFLTGTTDAMAKLRLLDRRELAPGETAMAQLNLDREIATQASEYFLIRSSSPLHTIGGGRILEVNAKRHRRFDESIMQRLRITASGDLDRVVSQRIEECGAEGIELAALANELGVAGADLEVAVERLGVVAIGKNRVVTANAYSALKTDIVTVLERFHEEHPYRNGVDIGSLSGQLRPEPGPEVLRHALRDLVEQKRVRGSREVLSIPDHDPFSKLGEGERKLVGEIEQAFLSYGLEPPSPESVIGSAKLKQAVFRLLLDSGRLVRLKTYKTSSSLVLHASALDNAKGAIERRFPYPSTFALKDIRDLLGSSRKYIVPLMEHLDATGATVRSGDLRRLRDQ